MSSKLEADMCCRLSAGLAESNGSVLPGTGVDKGAQGAQPPNGLAKKVFLLK